MFKKILLIAVVVALGTLIMSHQSFAQGSTTNTTQTTTTPAKGKATVETKTTTTTPAAPRPAYDQEALKKMDDTLCTDGFDAKVGNDNKNICSGLASPTDIAYSCIWTKKGEAAYPATPRGPCYLDSARHDRTIVITKADYKSSPPLPYGTKVECCFRAAAGAPTTITTSTTTAIPKTK